MENLTPFIIFGPSKSGTTWLQKSLDSMPDVKCHFQVPLFPFTRQEFKDLTHPKRIVLNQKRSPFKNVFNSKLDEETYIQVNEFLKQNYLYQTKSIKSVANNEPNKEVLRAMQRGLLDYRGSKLCGTKAFTNLHNYFTIYPNGKCVFIVRDGRDVIVSRRFHALRMGIKLNGDERSKVFSIIMQVRLIRKITNVLLRNRDKDLSKFFFEEEELIYKNKVINRNVIDGYGGDWVKVCSYILKMKNEFSNNTLLVKYEDLKSNYEFTIRKILDFLGLEDNVEINVNTAVEVNQKVQFKNTSFFRKGIAGDWANYFDDADLDYYSKKYGNIHSKLGYNLVD